MYQMFNNWIGYMLLMEEQITQKKVLDLKESYLVQVAKYAFAQGIGHKPAFNW